ncbi:MAG TPA: TIGR01459 family HAD-type hydrolase [Acidisoma sp.]|jgi:HAD superfamily hydrolase (TIGR01459 family)|nr:TIGR01459 family HAD-type hydrolase [Acidisoma sp.]
MRSPRTIPRLDAVFDAADAFLLDQFGTLHDGVALYPGTAQAIARAKAAGKRIIILSNSGKRSQPNVARLARLGLGPDCYDSFLTSGEVVWRLLAARASPALATARRCLVLSRGADAEATAGLTLEQTDDAQQADLILLLGSEADRIGLGAYRKRLASAARRGVPCLCGNPDWLMVLNDGALAPAAGQIAHLYAELGGPVLWIGKPHAAIYEAAFTELATMAGMELDRDRVWAVGDSLEHDVAGAAAQGCRSVLVSTGILAGSQQDAIWQEMAARDVWPDAILPSLA